MATICDQCDETTDAQELEHCDECGYEMCESCFTDDECRDSE